MTSTTLFRLVAWAPALLGLLLLGGGAVLMRRGRRFRGRGVRVGGTVVGDGYGGGNIAPVVAFTTLDGRNVTGRPRIYTDFGMSARGRQVPVWYDPEAPERFEASVSRFDRPGLVLLVAGAAVFVFWLVLWVPGLL